MILSNLSARNINWRMLTEQNSSSWNKCWNNQNTTTTYICTKCRIKNTNYQTNSETANKLWPGHKFLVCLHCDLDLGDMTLGQGHDTPLGHGQQLCEILSRSNKAVRGYGPDTDFWYACTMTFTLEIWLWYEILSRWIIKKLWPGHNVNRQTDGWTDRQIDRQTRWFQYCEILYFRGVQFSWFSKK